MNKFIGTIVIAFFGMLVLTGCSDDDDFNGGRGGEKCGLTSEPVEIGDLTWMSANLNVATVDSWCYDNDPANCAKYGRLYTRDAAMAVCSAVGWRLPNGDDWDALISEAGGWRLAGEALKAKSPDWDGAGDFGFSALPGGYRTADGSFNGIGIYIEAGVWWVATEYTDGATEGAVCWDMTSRSTGMSDRWCSQGYGYSVRCVRD